MKNSEFTNKNEKVCRLCEHGRLSTDKSAVVCMKKGIVDPDGKCRKYVYDPLKRDAKTPVDFGKFTAEDFAL